MKRTCGSQEKDAQADVRIRDLSNESSGLRRQRSLDLQTKMHLLNSRPSSHPLTTTKTGNERLMAAMVVAAAV